MGSPEKEVAASLGVPPLEIARPEDPASVGPRLVDLSFPRPAATLTQGRGAINMSWLTGTLIPRVISALVKELPDERGGLLRCLHCLFNWSRGYFIVKFYFIIV